MAIQHHTRLLTRPLQFGQRTWHPLLLGLLALPLLLFLFLPLLALLVRTGLTTVLTNVLQTQVMQAIVLSLGTSLLATLLAIVLGTPLAYLLARYQFRGRMMIETLIDLPMVLPPAVAGIALLMAFGRRGIVGEHLSSVGIEIAFTQVAVVLAQLFVAAPFYVKSAAAAFTRIEREAEEAAMIDGASGGVVFWYIILPLSWPVLFGGAVMTWARALGEFGATIIFAGNFPGRTQTMPLAIYIGFQLELSTALTLSIILLIISFGVLALVKGLMRQRIGATDL
ncbi:MAG: molybdate ABC transporter permease subunit [Chloroflexaceae bacterium]|nr:molybdate ABC transporter permease subunit [Chloroflexaceae bacterium]NJL34662.1 molybdate ABC transporter permease subunit [Chloroflexaceae bacterium]NJO06765.1 molybdate ABC transporter permease subunit [Chloroflexaceae bacterium]